jgi:hypothetical protein
MAKKAIQREYKREEGWGSTAPLPDAKKQDIAK